METKITTDFKEKQKTFKEKIWEELRQAEAVARAREEKRNDN